MANDISAKYYPLFTSVAMIAFAVGLSFVDLMFLNDVIGKVLDLGSAESMAIAFGLGLVGIAIMAGVGIMKAHYQGNLPVRLGMYMLWISLGFAFSILRIFSAEILQLDPSLGDEALLAINGLEIRQVDLVLGPLMLLLYIATGVMALEGFKHLFANPDFKKWTDERKKSKLERKLEEDKAKLAREEELQKARNEAERLAKEREEAMAQGRHKAALTKSYSEVLQQYRVKEREVMETYEEIARNIEYIRDIDKRERQFELKVKPGFRGIVHSSILTVQNETVLLMNRYNESIDITLLRGVVDSHNADRHEDNRTTQR